LPQLRKTAAGCVLVISGCDFFLCAFKHGCRAVSIWKTLTQVDGLVLDRELCHCGENGFA
jgi:lipoprotein